MRELNRYDFSNDKSFVTYLLSPADTGQYGVAECDIIGLLRGPIDDKLPMMTTRPDEALILAKLLIDAVWQVTEGYMVGEPKSQRPKFGGEDIDIGLRRDLGVPVVMDRSVPKGEIHLRQNGKTESVLKMSENGQCREVWRAPSNQ